MAVGSLTVHEEKRQDKSGALCGGEMDKWAEKHETDIGTASALSRGSATTCDVDGLAFPQRCLQGGANRVELVGGAKFLVLVRDEV